MDPQPPQPPQPPQQPYQQQPQGFPPPQGGYPQQPYAPQAGAVAGAAYGQPTKTSGAALASLICGILGCIPFVTSILAVILGIVGIRATSDPRRTGRGMAIVGLILGLIGIAGWGIFGMAGMAGWAMWAQSKPAAAVAQQFTSDLAKGDVAAAAKQCDPSVTEAQLKTAADELKSWGQFKDLTLPARNVDKSNGETTWNITGLASFAHGPKAATFRLRKESDGSYKITSFDFR